MLQAGEHPTNVPSVYYDPSFPCYLDSQTRPSVMSATGPGKPRPGSQEFKSSFPEPKILIS